MGPSLVCAPFLPVATVRPGATPPAARGSIPAARAAFRVHCAAEENAEAATMQNMCPGCGMDLAEAPNNCDREGHIPSGLGALLGFEWWPIKVYRPCPAFEAAGKAYVRKGQITNEILFRRKERSEL